MQDSRKILPETLETLLDRVSDPRRLGGHTRAFRIVGRKAGRELRTFRELRDFLSSMLEEEAAALMSELGIRMPDLTKNTVHATVRRLHEAA